MEDKDDYMLPVEDTCDHRTTMARAAVHKQATKPYPLNSKCLTSPYLTCVCRALGLSTNGAVEETGLMVEVTYRDGAASLKTYKS